MKYPGIRDVRSVVQCASQNSAGIKIDGATIWVPSRPLGWPSFRHRCYAAWLVFTGQADAVTYPGQ